MFVVYDVFSDQAKGSILVASDLEVPHRKCAVMVVTEESMQQAVGPVLGNRARLKRIYEDEQFSKKNKDVDYEAFTLLQMARFGMLSSDLLLIQVAQNAWMGYRLSRILRIVEKHAD